MAARLGQYRRKRHFAHTPEPAPSKRAWKRTFAPVFVVHKHDARRLHYDLRLEIDGALASWAVPKGPSFNPADRRLAVQTEDHPLEYAAFEGRIPEGEYGAGDSLLWDRGTFETVPPGRASEMRRAGHLLFELRGEKLKGRWHLVRTPGSGRKLNWLLFKARDEFASRRQSIVARRPESVVSGRRLTRGPIHRKTRESVHPAPMDLLLRVWPPMLATLREISTFHDDDDYVFEIKYDGFRALAGISNGRAVLQSRKGLDLAHRFPHIARSVEAIEAAEAVLDGEIVAPGTTGGSRLQALHDAPAKAVYQVFDLLWLDGQDLRDRPLAERRDLLVSVLANAPKAIRLAQRICGTKDEALDVVRRRGFEGVIAKRRNSTYQGARTSNWLKLKLRHSQEVAIVGYLPISTGAHAVGALLAAVHDAKGFRYAGKIGTGFTDRMRTELFRRLNALGVDLPPVYNPPRMRGARWVRTQLVAQVTFSQWTRDGRMREPSFDGLREDKLPEECVEETPRK